MMNNDNITIQQRSQDFAVRVIKAYTKINKKIILTAQQLFYQNNFLEAERLLERISEKVFTLNQTEILSVSILLH